MKFHSTLFVAGCIALGVSLLPASPVRRPKPDLDVIYETRTRTPKLGGVPQLTPTTFPEGQYATLYRTQTFTGERHGAQSAYWPAGAFSGTTQQTRERISGRIRYLYNPVTDAIETVNDSLHEVGGSNAAPWAADVGPFPAPPVLSVAIEPLSPVAPLGAGMNNPLKLPVVSATLAADDDLFYSGVGGFVGTSAFEFQHSYRMELSNPESVDDAEARAKVTTAIDVAAPGLHTSIRGTRKAGVFWLIREVTARYQIRDCAGTYALVKTYRKRPLNYIPGGEAAAWSANWTETEAVTSEGAHSPEQRFTLPLIDDHEVELVSLLVQPLVDCASCDGPGIAGGGSGPVNGSIDWSIPLGLKSDGRSVGSLLLHEASISAAIYTPAPLSAALDAQEGVARRNATGALRQVLVPQALVDVVTLTPASYELRFYFRDRAGVVGADGFHVPEGVPYLVWRIENPDVSRATSNRLRFTRTVGGESQVTEVDESQPGRRLFSEANGLRITETVETFVGSERVETVTVRDAAGQVASQRQTFYQTFDWGEERVKEVLDPNGAALTTWWAYQTNSRDPAYQQVTSIWRPDGSTEDFWYDSSGRQWAHLSPAWFVHRQMDSRFVTFADLDRDGMVDQLTSEGTKINQSMTRLEWVVDWARPTDGYRKRDRYQTLDGAALWDTPGNLLTRERYSVSDGSLIYRLTPDHQLQLTSKSRRPDGGLTKVTQQGAADAARERVVDGTATTEQYSAVGTLTSRVVTDLATGVVLDSTEVTAFDEFGRATGIRHLDGSVETREYCATCGQVVATTHRGLTIASSYDGLGRKVEESQSAGGVVLSRLRFRYDAEGRLIQRVRVDVVSGAETILAATSYDSAGRLISETNLGTGTTQFAYAFGTQGRTITTATSADGSTRIETRGASGLLLAVRGTAAAPVDYDYLTKSTSGGGNGYVLETRHVNDTGALTYQRQSFDLLGNVEFTEFPFPTNAKYRRTYDAIGRLVREEDPDGVSQLQAYDARGRAAVTALDLNRDGVIDYAGTDRITRTLSEVGTRDGVPVQRVSTQVWETDGVDSPTTIAVTETSLDGRRVWQTRRGLLTTVVTTFDGAGGRTVTTTAPDGVVTAEQYLGDRLISTTTRAADGTRLAAATKAYDGAGRLVVSDGSDGRSTYEYDAQDRVVGVTSPDPDPARTGPGYDPQTSRRTYDAMSRVVEVTHPDGSVTNSSYYPGGLLRRQWGALLTPVEYTYDGQRRLKSMTTWQDFAGDTGRATTTWNYDVDRGFLLNKRYPDGAGPDYLYSPGGRLNRYRWARGAAIARHEIVYNNAGEISQLAYTDTVPNTPDVSYTYDRLGRPRTIADGSGTRLRTYNAAGELAAESYTTGPLAGLEVQRSYDAVQRPEAVVAAWEGEIARTNYGYDGGSRLATIRSGAESFAYTYAAESLLPGTVAMATSEGPRLRTVRTYDALRRLTAVRHTPTGEPVALEYGYEYDALNRRTSLRREDRSNWSYAFDARGQLTSGLRRKSDGSPALGGSFSWSFDDIGNRRSAAVNGQTATYAANALNQYGQRTVPGVIELVGMAAADATVTFQVTPGLVTPQPVMRDGLEFRAQTAVDNSAAAQRRQIDVTAVKNFVGPNGEDAMATATRQVFVPRTPETFSSDLDGNLLSDARWTYTWDQQNRLAAMETSAGAVAVGVPREKLEFTYDSQHRRVAKQVSRWTASAWQLTAHTLFVYDGWNLIAELNALAGHALVRSYVWGVDLSGSDQGAGGVGGLLAVRVADGAGGGVTHFAAADGNGNVSALIDSRDGRISARYEYGPFGEPLRTDGPAAEANPFRFSTKFTDAESGLLYYGLRYYAPETGRWLSRDPLGEQGGANLYAFCGNDAVNQIDLLGLNPFRTVVNGLRQVLALPFDILSGDIFRTKILGEQFTDSQCEFLITVTGIRNNLNENLEFRRKTELYPEFRKIPVAQAIYNPTFASLVGDGLQIVGDEIMTIGAVSRLMAKTVEGAFQKAKSNHCALDCIKIFIEAHSQGGAIANRALALVSPQAKKHIYLVILGGQEDVSVKGLAGGRSIHNVHDIIPKIPNQPSHLWRNNSVETFNPLDLGYSRGSYDGPISSHSLESDSETPSPYLKYRTQHSW